MISRSEMTPLSVIELGPESMDQVEEFASFFIEEQESGRLDPLDVYLKCTAFEKALELVKKNLQKYATEEAEKYGKGEHEKKSFLFKTGEVGSKYVFDGCNDPVLKTRQKVEQQAKEATDQRKTFLKSLKESLTVVDDESGEVFTVHPPVKMSTTSVIVRVK